MARIDGGAEHVPRRRQHEERREAAEDEERGREGPAGVGAEPEPDEERGAEHHDSERHGARVGPDRTDRTAVTSSGHTAPPCGQTDRRPPCATRSPPAGVSWRSTSPRESSYVAIGVAFPEFLFSWVAAAGYLLGCVVVLPRSSGSPRR